MQETMEEITTYFFDTKKMEKFFLEVHLIKSATDLEKYDDFLEQLPENPFIKKELLLLDTEQNIGYFTLHNSENTLLVLLPFISRKIFKDNKDTGYLDIISPYGFAGPVIKRGIDESKMKQFWEHVDKWYINNNVISEFIRFNFNNNSKGFTGEMVPTLEMVCGEILPEPEQWKNFKPKVRNNVRKALNHGLKCIVYHKNINNIVIKDLYKVYSKTMKRHNAELRYHFSLDFFKDFIKNNSEICSVAIVYDQNKAVSAELLLLSEGIMYSFLGGTNEAHFDSRPNDLLKVEVMAWARKNGYNYYFLGGGKKQNDSLYHYKKSFFPKDRDTMFYTGRKILNFEVYKNLVANNPHATKSLSSTFFPLYRYKENN